MTVSRKRNIVLVSGGWGQNIGNAFFNIGGLYLLRKIFPNYNVQLIQDQPGYWTFNRKRTNPKNYWGLLGKLDVDYIVLQGPIFSLALPKLWDATLTELYARGGKVIYLSAAFFKYTDEEYLAAVRFLKKFPPLFLSTRDTPTYCKLQSCCEVSYDGICSAWFVPEVYKPAYINSDDYIVMNFDRLPEPTIKHNNNCGKQAKYSVSTIINDNKVILEFPMIQYKLAIHGKASSYVGALLDRRKLPEEYDGTTLIRTEHRTNPYFNWKIYKNPNSLASDEPYTYFTIYANSSLTLTDRVHACLITLAYGKPAMLFTNSPRINLFDRLGLMGDEGLTSRPVTIDLEYLDREKQSLMDYLTKHLEVL